MMEDLGWMEHQALQEMMAHQEKGDQMEVLELEDYLVPKDFLDQLVNLAKLETLADKELEVHQEEQEHLDPGGWQGREELLVKLVQWVPLGVPDHLDVMEVLGKLGQQVQGVKEVVLEQLDQQVHQVDQEQLGNQVNLEELDNQEDLVLVYLGL